MCILFEKPCIPYHSAVIAVSVCVGGGCVRVGVGTCVHVCVHITLIEL